MITLELGHISQKVNITVMSYPALLTVLSNLVIFYSEIARWTRKNLKVIYLTLFKQMHLYANVIIQSF